MSQRLKRQVIRALPWSVAESVVNGLAGVGLMFVLAWLLEPAEIGQATIALSVVGVVEVIAGLGMVEALVGARSGDTRVSDTAFTTVVAASLVAAGICYLLAGPVGHLYREPHVTELLHVAVFILPINALVAIPTGLFIRKMRAAAVTVRMTVSRVATILATGILAYLHFGAWAVVAGTLIGSCVTLAVILPLMPRVPRFRFSTHEFRKLFVFGAALSVERLLWGLMIRLFWLVLGYVHGPAVLGLFQFAQRLIDETANLVQTFVIRFGLSLFAALERAGRDPTEAFLKATRLISAVAVPIFTGLALVMPDLIGTVFASKWAPAVIVAQVAALGWVVSFPRSLVGAVLRARGRQAGLVGYAALACGLTIVAGLMTGGQGLLVIALAWITRHFVGIPWGFYAIHRYLGTPVKRQVAAAIRPMIAAAIMAAAVTGVSILMQGMPGIERLVAEIATGTVVYAVALSLIDRETLRLLAGFAGDLRRLSAPVRQQPAE
ncbi:MAG TPA: oligosaccharide flippase family protein [Pseudolabrys sp.]|nr:oligosaccharide flippase family protein [Pseudolabrys sp.]